jgi:nanoRNase/pAp phosphatase (c-di-AMP/oligoRNAs hydrolase)
MSQAEAVFETLDSAASLAIVCHDDPDPDCLAGAIALEFLAKERGIDTVDILYGGTISHQQNRAFVNVFDVTLDRYSDERLTDCELVAFVDHSFPGTHNSVPADTEVDIVIDHHPPDQTIPADVVDVREEYGATATILTEYFRELSIELSTRIASGLLFGLHRERLDYIRQPTVHEYEAAGYLDPRADVEMLRELYGASFTADTVDALGTAIHNRVRRDGCLVSCVGKVTGHDSLTQAADYLLNIEGVRTVLVWGVVDDEIQLSARSVRGDIDLGERLTEAFGDVGNAGGHRDMAGGQLPLGLFGDVTDDDDRLLEMIDRRVRDRFFDVMGVSED